MATKCEANKWFWYYFTSENNIAKCDICDTVLKTSQARKGDILRHIETQHRDDYQRIVSSGISQEDLESQLYIIQDNDMTCKFCCLTFDAINDFYSIRRHLEKTHKIKEDRATEICDWLRKYYFDQSDTDMKRRCRNCKETILNKPLVLMSHLNNAHEVNVTLESVGFLTSKNWMWAYYTRNNIHAKCSVCSKTYLIKTNIKIIINHIKMAHGNMFDVTENSQAYENWPYSITENDQVQCDNCNENYALIFYASTQMRTHLTKKHNINEEIARKLCNWVSEYFHISNLQTSKCNRCENVFRKSNFFNLMIHLKEAHQISVHPEIIPAGLSTELSSLLNPDRCAENNAPSTSCNQPSRNVDQSSDRENLYEEIDNFSEMKTRLSSELSSIFKSDRRAENNAPSTTCNQPTRNVDQSSDCDDLYDQINNPSEMETTRSSSVLSSLFNSDRCAENNAPSISNNQPPRNVDQSSDCDNHYVQIDNTSEIKTTRYKKWRKSRYY